MNKVSNLFFVAFIALSVNVFAQNDIKLNLEVGSTYTLSQETKSIVNQMINGMPQDVEMTINAVTDYKVTGMNGKNFLIDIEPKSMKTTQNAGGMNLVMDSEGDLSDPMNKIMSNLVGKVMKMEVTPYGEITMFNANDFVKGMMDGVDMPAMALSQLEGQLASEYDDASLKDTYLGLLNIYPNKKVAIGDSWTTDLSADVVMPMTSTATNTLMEIKDGMYVIESKADISSDESEKTEMMGMQATSDIEGTSNTTYSIDRKTGWIKKMSMTQDLDGTVTLPASEQMPQEMKIKMKIKNTTTIK
ncbi:MAG: DUF6263 family protein [Nonlabens sp.]